MMSDMKWSDTEKKAARKVFDAAYMRECNDVIAGLKERALKASAPEDIWKLHEYLMSRRREIEQKYDYRYSELILVFGILLREGWITADDLSGLAEDKIGKIKQIASL